MRRFVTLAVLVFFAIPFGISVTGCKHALAPDYCNGETSGVQTGQLTTLDLEPRLTGISLNEGEIGRVNSPTGKDCKGNAAGASNVIYASTNLFLADVAPSTGSLCAGSWNRNTGGGIADYTVCTPSPNSGVAYITASSGDVVSNAIPVFIHPTVTSIVLGPASTDCTTDPASNCVDLTQVSGCDSGPVITAAAYNGNSCVSQGGTAQLVARTYINNSTSAANNISCQVGPLTFSSTNSSVVTIDANGLATAAAPGSAIITANTSQASSTAGFFSTCPPKTIVLTTQGQTAAPAGPVSVNQNTTQTLSATVTDTNGVVLNNLALEYVSTSPNIIPANSNAITPNYPGSAIITAICQPSACNPAPFNEIGLFGNGTPITSNPVQINATGTNFSTVLYIASTDSLYLLPVDFTVTTQAAPVRLPYPPNSFVITQDLSTIYMGTDHGEIMVFSTGNNSLIKQDTSVTGQVLAASPDSTTVIVTDPNRQLIYLYNSSGGVNTEYGGVATSAQFSPDSQTVYITTKDGRLLVHSTFTGWSAIPLTTPATGVAVTIPSLGAYLASAPVDVRTNCPATTPAFPLNPVSPGNPAYNPSGFSQSTTNSFYPDLGPVAANATSIAATANGLHMLAAYTPASLPATSTFTDIATNAKNGNCPVPFTSTPGTPIQLTGIGTSATVNNVLTTTDSNYAFVTYSSGSTTAGKVPQYVPGGALTYLPFQLPVNPPAVPTAPVAGVVSANNGSLFVGTSGDNLVHIFTLPTGGGSFSETTTPITPALPSISKPGGNAVPNLLAQKPRKATS